jgi:hypothetical protein
MTTSSPPESGPLPALAVTLQDFFDRLAGFNPFVANRVLQPAANDVDADHVHHAPFQRLVELARTTHEHRIGIGAVLWGVAGVGKSHLLSRLWRWADRHGPCFAYLQNLQASPQRLPAYVLNVVVSVLTHRQGQRFSRTPLFGLLDAAIREALHHQALTGPYTWVQIEAAYARLIHRFAAANPSQPALVSHAIYEVLARFYRRAHPRSRTRDEDAAESAVRWLGGESLEPGQAGRLGLGAPWERWGRAGDDQHAKEVLVALAQIASCRGQPLILAFDQVDNLAAEQAAALTRFLQALLDSAPNLLVVTSGVQTTLLQWHNDRVIQDSAWDRVAQFEVPLHRVSAEEGRQIVQAHLERFLEPFYDTDPVRERVQADGLFPLGRKWFQEYLQGKSDLRPRDALSWARKGWHQEQQVLKAVGGPAWLAGWATPRSSGGRPPPPTGQQLRDLIDREVEVKIAELKAQREQRPETLPPAADNLAELTSKLLQQCMHRGGVYNLLDVKRPVPPAVGIRPTYDLLIRQRTNDGREEVSVGVVVVTAEHGNAAYHVLRRIQEDPAPPRRCYLVTDERRQLPLGQQGEELLRQLQRDARLAFRTIEVTFAEYAELDALQGVIGLALSGDLEVGLASGEVRAVTDRDVIESHHRRQRYLAHRLLRELLAEGSPPPVREPPSPPAVSDREVAEFLAAHEQAVRQFLMAQFALNPGASPQELAGKCASHLQALGGAVPDRRVVHAGLQEITSRMQQEGLISASSLDQALPVSTD